MYLALEDIKEIQIDHTTRCNLGCPQCARSQEGWSKNPSNMNIDLSLDDYKILLEPFQENILNVFHCGNYGDAIASPNFNETFTYTMSKNPKRISVSTNGSLRTASWWSQLAQEGGSKLRVNFAIDGLADTNSTYRIGANWDKLIKNVKAFIDSGGKARWDFIEFEHNYHQIEEAESLAKELGFEKFNVKYTARFANRGVKSDKLRDGKDLKDSPKNINQASMNEINQKYSSFDDYINTTQISCKYKKEQKVFVDMHMKLWPCCWLGAPLYFQHKNKQGPSFDHLTKKYGNDFNDLRKHGWKVLEHDFFQKYLENSWDNPDKNFKRIYTCGRTCGEKFEFSSGYGKNSNIKSIKKPQMADVSQH